MSRRTLSIILTLALALGVGVYVVRPYVALAIVDYISSKRMGDLLSDLPDGLHIGLCGTGSPFPDPDRSAPCNVIVAGQQVILIDAGSGTPKQLARMSLNSGLVDHVFLTHFHSDHIDGLGEVMLTRWAQRRADNRLTVHGPAGVAQVVEGFEKAYRTDSRFRTAHHGENTMPLALSGALIDDFGFVSKKGQQVFNQDGLVIYAYPVDHSPVEPALAYRIEYKGRSVVISGDTSKNNVVIQAAKGADLLIHEALHPQLLARLQGLAEKNNRVHLAKILADIHDYHTSPVQAAEVAQQAGVKALVFSHIVPPLPLPPLKKIFLEGTANAYSGQIKLGEDGDWIYLSPHNDDIEFSRRFR